MVAVVIDDQFAGIGKIAVAIHVDIPHAAVVTGRSERVDTEVFLINDHDAFPDKREGIAVGQGRIIGLESSGIVVIQGGIDKDIRSKGRIT